MTAPTGKTGRKPEITVVLRTWRSEPLRHAIMQAAQTFGWRLIDLEVTRFTLPMGPPQGAIVTSLAPSLLRQLLNLGCSVVHIGFGSATEYGPLPAVLLDLVHHGHQAADHFADRGFRHVAYVGHAPWAEAKPLYDGFRERAQQRHCTCALLQFKSPPTASQTQQAALFTRRTRELQAWLAGLPRPVGVLTYSDAMAGNLCVMAMAAGFAVPEEVAIMGRGNDHYACETSPVALSSIDEDYEAIGRTAACLLHRLMGGETAPNAPIIIPPKGIVERQSTDVLAVDDPVVAHALHFMWDRLDRDLGVADVARAVGVPRHRLEQSFRALLGRGVNAELRRKRLERVCELLRTGGLTVAEIASRTGFGSKDYLHEAFRKTLGMTPRQYRLQARPSPAP